MRSSRFKLQPKPILKGLPPGKESKMNKMEFLEYAIGLCEKEIEEDIKSCSINRNLEELIGISRGLHIAKTITEENWSENAMMKYIRNMIEHI